MAVANKPQTASMPPETSAVSPLAPRGLDEDAGAELRASSEKDGERCTRSGRRTRRTSRAPSQGHTSGLGGRGSLRWEGVLEDPRAEEQRLELYRADRRRRYIAHREALLKEGGDGLKQTCVKKSSEIKALTEADHQVTPLLLHLSMES
ncbi:protein LIAT1 isoform X2 [Betta splendens]|uniref:Protein LIAT1 isoform X2 n=1 Tax=Betta splendens TaxID=158456 RepID=A0A6P7PDC1_BETSP|nr:protein LIAT1 isoform X2 [Betta splendens]